jgi:hypothetical protein
MSTAKKNSEHTASNKAETGEGAICLRRLKKAGLQREPVALDRKTPQQFEAAMIAATLTRQTKGTPLGCRRRGPDHFQRLLICRLLSWAGLLQIHPNRAE